MQIYIHRDNQQLGPFTEAEIKTQLASGAISLQDHVWWEGQANWAPLGESSLAAALSPASPAPAPVIGGPLPGTPAVAPVNATVPETSKLAVWALVCGCLSLICNLLTAIPAIIFGHMGLSEIKKNPAIPGRGMAMAGMIIGYIITALTVVYIVLVCVVFASMGSQVKDIFKTITSQIAAAQAAQGTNGADQSATNSDQTTNAPDSSTPAPATTNTPDQSTNSAPAATNSPDSSTNTPAPSTNAPASSTNAAPMTQ
jgi:uncharacterized protein DUF4190/uncharacterized protein DUF4339